MKDVARSAGVSLKTVSRFVNGETNISPGLAARIEKAIGELGYRRNLAAASIRPGWSSKMIGLIISDLANPYYSTLARTIEAEVAERGYLLIVASSEEKGERHDRLVRRLMEQRVDGLIVVPPRHPGRAWSELPPPVPPIVFLDRPSEQYPADIVLADNAGGAEAATYELHRNGANRIAFVGDALDIFTIRERYRGYCEALSHLGVEYRPERVAVGAHSREEARTQVAELITRHHADGIFAANNRAALGAIEAFQTHAVDIPIIGFDDFEAAHLIGVGVSVVSQDIDRMARKAAGLLLSRLNGSTTPHRSLTLPTQLVLRGSEARRPAPPQS